MHEPWIGHAAYGQGGHDLPPGRNAVGFDFLAKRDNSDKISHRRARAPGSLDDPPLPFRLALLGREKAQLLNEKEGPPLTLTGIRATGEAYTLAHHLTIDGGNRRLMIAALRYSDQFVKFDDAGLIHERPLYVDW